MINTATLINISNMAAHMIEGIKGENQVSIDGEKLFLEEIELARQSINGALTGLSNAISVHFEERRKALAAMIEAAP